MEVLPSFHHERDLRAGNSRSGCGDVLVRRSALISAQDACRYLGEGGVIIDVRTRKSSGKPTC